MTKKCKFNVITPESYESESNEKKNKKKRSKNIGRNPINFGEAFNPINFGEASNPINFGEASNPNTTNFGNTINVEDFVSQFGLGSEVMDYYPTPIYAEQYSEEPGPLDSVVENPDESDLTLYKIARRTSDDFIINKIRDLEKRIKELEKKF
ncbi:16716_t:CDS:1 [Gigaspora margarita]|uniref:16716_t:CDS:1 n=1 Tax=Gigaspora margarita TaxID=4874 RepID=A0ABN7W770_GIGMA|nr:16716_t:CDS:1 [Gigaspora margarita]